MFETVYNAAAILIPKALPCEEFLKWFKYKHEYFDTEKETLPIAIFLDFNRPQNAAIATLKNGKILFSHVDKETKGDKETIKFVLDETGQSQVDSSFIVSEINELTSSENNGTFAIEQFKDKTSYEIVQYLKTIDIPDITTIVFVHCSDSKDCIVGRKQDMCAHCPLFEDWEQHEKIAYIFGLKKVDI